MKPQPHRSRCQGEPNQQTCPHSDCSEVHFKCKPITKWQPDDPISNKNKKGWNFYIVQSTQCAKANHLNTIAELEEPGNDQQRGCNSNYFRVADIKCGQKIFSQNKKQSPQKHDRHR